MHTHWLWLTVAMQSTSTSGKRECSVRASWDDMSTI